MDSSTAIYSLTYESTTTTQILANTSNEIKNVAKHGFEKGIAETMFRLVKPGIGQFKQARENCKVAGKLLACYLALRRGISKSQTVSLIGFSLGTQVIKSCVKTLHNLYHGPDLVQKSPKNLHCDIIHNVTLLGGASHYDNNKQKWKNIYLNIVNGTLKNVHSDYDRALQAYTASEKQFAIGRNPIKLDEEETIA